MTTDLSGWVVLDLQSDTYFDASNAYLVHLELLPACTREEFIKGFDVDRLRIAERCGIDLENCIEPNLVFKASSDNALDAIAELLSKEEWSADSVAAVAEMVRLTGRTIKDLDFSAPADAGDDS